LKRNHCINRPRQIYTVDVDANQWRHYGRQAVSWRLRAPAPGVYSLFVRLRLDFHYNRVHEAIWTGYNLTQWNNSENHKMLHWYLSTEICYTPKTYIAVVRNHFSEITPANRNRVGPKIYRETSAEVMRFSANFWRPPPNARKWRRKTRILRTFLSPKQSIVSPTFRRPIYLKFEHKTWIDVVVNSFWIYLRNFSGKGSFISFISKPNLGSFPAHFRARAPWELFSYFFVRKLSVTWKLPVRFWCSFTLWLMYLTWLSRINVGLTLAFELESYFSISR